MSGTQDTKLLTKAINEKGAQLMKNYNSPNKGLNPMQDINKSLPLKQLDFNPLSFINTKY